jgi:hypothetical protein
MIVGQAIFFLNDKEVFKSKGITRPVRAFAALGSSDFSITLVEPRHGSHSRKNALALACLGDAEECREGVIKSIYDNSGQKEPLCTVASIHNGVLCDYSFQELAFADGSLPDMELNTDQAHAGGNKVPIVVTLSSLIPKDWGACFIETVKVSTDSKGNGPLNLNDEIKTTYWMSNGPPGSHYIEVFLSKAMKLEELGIIIDGSDDKYCPTNVRVLVGDSITALQDLGLQTFSCGAGLHYACLLKDTSLLSVVKVCIEKIAHGGVNCKVYGVRVKPGRKFKAGDHVVLSDTYFGEAWNLRDGKVGVVVCIPYDGVEEQRGMIVAALDDPADCCCFRSSWLKHAAIASDFQYKLGDLVQLDVLLRAEEPNVHMHIASKCLGPPAAMQYGIVLDEGVVRNNIQRNIEVVTIADSLDSCELDRIGEAKRHSLYCARDLQPAAPSNFLSRRDQKTLIQAVQHVMETCGFKVDLDMLVHKEGANIWSKIWDVSKGKIGEENVTREFYRWQSGRNQRMMDSTFEDLLQAAYSKQKTKVSFEVCSSESIPCFWTCKCGFSENLSGISKCLICKKRGKSWKCSECGNSNNVVFTVCNSCQRPKCSTGREENDGVMPGLFPSPAHESTVNAESSFRWIRPSQTYQCFAEPNQDSQVLGELAVGFSARAEIFSANWLKLDGDERYVEVIKSEDVVPLNTSGSGSWVCARPTCIWSMPCPPFVDEPTSPIRASQKGASAGDNGSGSAGVNGRYHPGRRERLGGCAGGCCECQVPCSCFSNSSLCAGQCRWTCCGRTGRNGSWPGCSKPDLRRNQALPMICPCFHPILVPLIHHHQPP